ncbi:MAG: hypothetical protein COT24_01690 [Candidatus Kerfeldbacteria bacterium CG08_land_8_20_14_0_20_40_16]|uniref:Uncharacterized protein n=1 Tax=Candidatus Kerfeldbacteria bacterium CG08_land_8_20_14_0_20_40_16 TaxID=2014244 RepID=A0A2H0YYK5_9BACT|nr:MAG: hypothetical protein COT24_01690 [Candidatus Kerfeldbacteria bacterium CG08_land_8_20_14_0_20_40_16]
MPKSTISNWCKGIKPPAFYTKKIESINQENLKKAREIAVQVNRIRREKYLANLRTKNLYLINKITKDVSKIALAVLFLGEGSKSVKGTVIFGNSDPAIIQLFLGLLRKCYKIDESKFRCTVQCRADQDTVKLEQYWSKITRISLNQFYKARIDPRTVNRPTLKLDYKGVCRIDYFSADVYNELKVIYQLICQQYEGP